MKEDLLFGRIALLNNIINKEQLEEAISTQKNSIPLRSISYILRQKGQIKRSQVKAILQAQKKNLPRPVKSPEERKEDMAFGYIAFRNDYLTIDNLVRCLKLQGDIAKKGLLFRLSEILYNEKYLTYEDIEKVIDLQQEKILPCAECQTPYNIVGLPSKARFPCRKCQKIVEVPEDLAAEDESDRLEKYKADIEAGIIKIQQEQMPVVQAIVDSEEEDIEETSQTEETSDQATQKEQNEQETPVEDSEHQEDESVDKDGEQDDELKDESVDKDDEQDDEFEDESLDKDHEQDDEFEDESLDKDSEDQDDEDEFSELEDQDEEFIETSISKSHEATTDSIEEELFAEVNAIESSNISHAGPREISLDNDEMFAQEMPNLEDVTAKATAKMKDDYSNHLKRKSEFIITTSDLSFFPEETDTAQFEIGAMQSLTSFSEDEFSIAEDDFFEETVYKKDPERKKVSPFVETNSDRFSFTSRLKVETKNEDDVLSMHSPNKKANKPVKKNDRRTQILRMNLDLADEDPNELFEDEMISIGPDALKKHKKSKRRKK